MPFSYKGLKKINVMKTIIPNQFINHQANKLLDKTSETMKIKVLLLLMLVTLSTGMFAQDSENTDVLTISEISTVLNSQQGAMRRTSQPSLTSQTNSRNLEKLILENQPSVYFYSGNVETHGEKPSNLFTDLNSIRQISNANFLKDYVEIIIISVKNSNELNGVLDMSLLSELKKLKYVYFVSNANVSESDFTRMIQNNDDKYSFYYKIENKS
jgi:hypothetical protein